MQPPNHGKHIFQPIRLDLHCELQHTPRVITHINHLKSISLEGSTGWVWETRPVEDQDLRRITDPSKCGGKTHLSPGRWPLGVGDAALVDRVTLLGRTSRSLIEKRLGTASDSKSSFPAFSAPPTWDTSAGNPKSRNFLLFLSMFCNREASYGVRTTPSSAVGDAVGSLLLLLGESPLLGESLLLVVAELSLHGPPSLSLPVSMSRQHGQSGGGSPPKRRHCEGDGFVHHTSEPFTNNSCTIDGSLWWQQSRSVAAGVEACWDGGLECSTWRGGLGGLGLG